MTETKDRITPTAFAPAPVLMNLPLARPWRRAISMLCDLAVIAFLTELGDSGMFLFLLVLWLLYRFKLNKLLASLGRYRAWTVRLASLVVVAVSLFLVFDEIVSVNNSSDKVTSPSHEESISISQAIESIAHVVSVKDCHEVDCYQEATSHFIAMALQDDSEFSNEDVTALIDESLPKDKLAPQQLAQLKQWAAGELARQKTQIDSLEPAKAIEESGINLDDEDEQAHGISPLRWFIGFVEDLGLGFGFAAIYFSCFTAWFNGQTFGKMLLNIRVIQLNNTNISLWESFGRYGGYGAGLATGLLGFLQIYWDPNRQAIQDKISATVVIDLGLQDQEALQMSIQSCQAQQVAQQQLTE